MTAAVPRRFFRKFAIKRQEFGDSRLLAPFRTLAHEPRYWGIRRRTVVPAFALGLFLSWMPVPGHYLLAAIIALMMHVNLPVAVATTFISNPFTMPAMYYSAYRLGRWLLDTERVPFRFELSLSWVTEQFVMIWQPMLLGCVLLGSIAALLGYVIVDVLWRLSLYDYKSRKRRLRRDGGSD